MTAVGAKRGPGRRPDPADGAPTVAVVLSGAAARGAFQAGALSVLVPALHRVGLRPTIWVGTSAGSINAVLCAAAAHRDADAAGAGLLDVWRSIGDDDVYASLLPFSLARVSAQFAAGAVLGVGPGTTSLLDTSPLRRTAHRLLPTDRLAANVAGGAVAALGVVTTRMPPPGADGGARSVLFLHEHIRSGWAGDPERALDVVRGAVRPDHVLASAAVPVAFSPVRVSGPDGAEAWYLDGGVRLNTPLLPALRLGATHVVIVSAGEPAAPAGPGTPAGPPPDVADAAAQVLHAALSDRTGEDLRTLRRTNRLVAQVSAAGRPDLLRGSAGGPYRHVEVMAVSPPAGALGRAAVDVLARRTRGLGRLRELDTWLLGQGVRGAGDAAGRRDLLSYLLFDPEYFDAGIGLGRRAARAALRRDWAG